MRLVLDNTTLNRLTGQADLSRHDLDRLKLGLKRKTVSGEWHVPGSIFLIAEMCGIGDSLRFKAAFSLYWKLVQGQLLKPWPQRITDELRLQRPLRAEEMMLDEARVAHVYREATTGARIHDTLEEVQEQKGVYESAMREIKRKVHNDQRWRKWTKIDNVHRWIAMTEGFMFDWILQRYSPQQATDAPVPCASLQPALLQRLPATRACAWFMLTKLFEHMVLGTGVDKGDLYDRSYYIDAVPGGYLVTDDRNLIRTCGRIPQRSMAVLRFKSLAFRLGERRVASKLRRTQ